MCSVFFLFWESPPNFTINPLSANPTKWPNTLKQFVGKLRTTCVGVFGHFVNLAPKGLKLLVHFIFNAFYEHQKSFFKSLNYQNNYNLDYEVHLSNSG